MDIRLTDHFDPVTLQRGQDYALRGFVTSVERLENGVIQSRVSNGAGAHYLQHITFDDDWVEGVCSCPVGHNCKHVAAAMTIWVARPPASSGLGPTVKGWLRRVSDSAAARQPFQTRPDAYPDTVKDRLLFVLSPYGVRFQIEPCKGRIDAAGTALTASIQPYNAAHVLHSAEPAKFIRPLDLELLAALASARIWQVGYGYGLPDLLRPKGAEITALIRRLCETGRFLHDRRPDSQLRWSDEQPTPRLLWRMAGDGRQRLEFADATGQRLQLRGLDEVTFFVDVAGRQIGVLDQNVSSDVLHLAEACPAVGPEEVEALGAALPATLAGLALPRPIKVQQVRRPATRRVARLTLGRETVRSGPRYYGSLVALPVLTLRFVYDGQETGENDADPRLIDGDEIVILARDRAWEGACASRLMEAGALPVEHLELLENHWPGEAMMKCDFVFTESGLGSNLITGAGEYEILDFAFRLVPELRREGWEVVETSNWPYRLSAEQARLAVTTRNEAGEPFQGNDWFSLGFTAELDGKPVDIAPLVAAFLDQIREDWEVVPDAQALEAQLAARPIYVDRGKAGFVALDLSPLAPLLHLFLTHHAELGALHPADANTARLAAEALAGSTVQFSDKAGILPLAKNLNALATTRDFAAPEGLKAKLRDYQAYGFAWMSNLLEAGFGGVLADDMGLGKTLQTLALLQARREARAPGPALLIVPTSVLYSWQSQAAQFTPDLRLVTLHGTGRAAERDSAMQADLVMTTYPLLARDRAWLVAQDWPLVILDEAQTLKNPASQMAKTLREIPAKGRLALTGTPLENSLQDVWTLTDWINPGLLGDRKRFQTLFRTPIEKHGDLAAQARLNRRLRPFLLRRTKEAVAAELPPRTEILERIDLPKSQQILYETVRSAMDIRVRDAIARRGIAASRITVLDALLKLRQVCCDPSLVKTQAARSVTESGKRARLCELLAELVSEGRRVLVFSQFVTRLKLIETDLAQAGIDCLTLTGQTRDRASLLDAFARGDCPVFLLSLKAGGVGLTLTEADTVILYDPWWNPAVERQAMDRTHRIGQDKPVFVHRLVAAGTVEEKILDMQARKQALADALFREEPGASDTLIDEATLRDLFAPLIPS
jgi:superfamily II DNA or RNA helicase